MNVDLRQTFYEHIAVATDFSPHADLALSYAIRTAKLHGAALDILHVVQDLIVYPEDPSMMVPLGDMADQLAKIAEAQMDDWEASADKAAKAAERREALRAQGKARAADRASDGAAERLADFRMPNGAEVKACGGGTQQMEDV